MEKPKKLREEHLDYLDVLRISGVTNMYGATPYLQDAFPKLNRDEAQNILSYWMKTFSERNAK